MTAHDQLAIAVHKCIYCGSLNVPLTDEHVVPYGLSGNLVLPKSSCIKCAAITSKLELKLLRGHWWPYRQFLGLKSRRRKKPLPELQVSIEHASGEITAATLPMEKHSFSLVFQLAPPTILLGKINSEVPYATSTFIRILGPMPATVRVNGKIYKLGAQDKITVPVNFHAPDLCRFLAKIAHSYAIFRRGPEVCKEYFLPRYVLGEEAGAMTYVGGASSDFLGSWLPGNGTHALMDRIQGQYLSVYIQLFRHNGDPPPIYEVVVGRLAPNVRDA